MSDDETRSPGVGVPGTVPPESARRQAVVMLEDVAPSPYSSPMTVSAHDVAAVLRERLPGLAGLKLHKLLYYVQAHHLAVTGEPLFGEAVTAWDMGPVVAPLWTAEDRGEPAPPRRTLTDGHLNVIDYVITRYGALSGIDLMHLTHAEDPWLLADRDRPPKGSARIRNEWMRDYFRAEPHDEGEVWFTPEKVAELAASAAERRRNMGPPDPASNDRLWATFDGLLGEPRA